MSFQDNLATNVFAAFSAGQGQQDRRVRRNALMRYADSLQPGQDPGPSPIAQPNSLTGVAGLVQPPITGSALTPALPAGSPPVAGPAGIGTTYTAPMSRSPSPMTDPRRASALSDLVRMGDFETINSLNGLDDRRRSEDTRNRIAPDIRDGRLGMAARTAAADGQTELATSLYQMDRADLSNVATRGERGASALYAALALPKEQRSAYMAQHRDLATDAGISPEQFASFDWSNDQAVRSVADRWQDASKMAGEVSLQRFGDNVQTVRTGPSGTQVLDSREVPQTRAEQLDASRVNYAQSSDQRDYRYRETRDQADDAYRNSRAASEDAYRKWQQENPNSRGDVEGVVLSKAVREGAAALSTEEKAIYDRYLASSSSTGNELLGLLGGGAPGTQPGGQPTPAQRPAPVQPGRGGPAGAAGTQQNPARPRTTAEAQALPAGSYFLDPSGNLIQRQ